MKKKIKIVVVCALSFKKESSSVVFAVGRMSQSEIKSEVVEVVEMKGIF